MAMVSKVVKVIDEEGLHLRPATNLCKVAVSYPCHITFRIRDYEANAKSVLSVLAAMVKKNDEIEIICDGENEQEALDALVKQIRENAHLSKA